MSNNRGNDICANRYKRRSRLPIRNKDKEMEIPKEQVQQHKPEPMFHLWEIESGKKTASFRDQQPKLNQVNGDGARDERCYQIQDQGNRGYQLKNQQVQENKKEGWASYFFRKIGF